MYLWQQITFTSACVLGKTFLTYNKNAEDACLGQVDFPGRFNFSFSFSQWASAQASRLNEVNSKVRLVQGK